MDIPSWPSGDVRCSSRGGQRKAGGLGSSARGVAACLTGGMQHGDVARLATQVCSGPSSTGARRPWNHCSIGWVISPPNSICVMPIE